MSTEFVSSQPDLDVIYPDTDGAPMGQSDDHVIWITLILQHFRAMFAEREGVSVHGDMFWYPVQGNPRICAAPDTMIIFGRPSQRRKSYKQWEEGGVAPQVTFEVESPNATSAEIEELLEFYDRYGVEEYYVYDFTRGELQGYRRDAAGALTPISQMQGWVSPLLGVRFELEEGQLRLFSPDGQVFDDVKDGLLERSRLRVRAERERARAERERERAEREKERAERLEKRLRELGFDPDAETPPTAT